MLNEETWTKAWRCIRENQPVAIALPPDVQQMVAAMLASGRYESEEEVLRNALRALVEQDEDLDAVREALSEWKDGDPGMPLAEAFEAIRSRADAKGTT